MVGFILGLILMAHVHTKKEYNILGLTHQEMVWLGQIIQRGLLPTTLGQFTDEERRFLTNLRASIEKEIRFTGGSLSAKDV